MKRNYERGEGRGGKKEREERGTQHLQSLAEDIGGKIEYRLSNLNPK